MSTRMSDPADSRVAQVPSVPAAADPRPHDKEDSHAVDHHRHPAVHALEQFDAVMAEVGDEPEGLEARYVGTTDGELRVVSLWESKAHADRFFAETLGPALAKALGPEPAGAPRYYGIEVARSYARQPVH